MTLEIGKVADIVGVSGNPLEDIGALKRVKTVIAGGRVRRKE
jgi:imidazolonepropionase-like amidohydrolase